MTTETLAARAPRDLSQLQTDLSGLLAPSIARNEHRLAQSLAHARLAITEKSLFDFFNNVQFDITKRIAQMEEARAKGELKKASVADELIAALPSTDCDSKRTALLAAWNLEEKRIVGFFGHLNRKPETQFVYKMCNRFVIKTAEDIVAITNEQYRPDRIAGYAHFEEAMKHSVSQAIESLREEVGLLVLAADRELACLEFEASDDYVSIEVDNVPQPIKEVKNSPQPTDEQKAREVGFLALKNALRDLIQKNDAIAQFNRRKLDISGEIPYVPDLSETLSIQETELPKTIASLLLTKKGEINLGLVGPIKEVFFPKNRELTPFEKDIIFILDSMDLSWQPLIHFSEEKWNWSMSCYIAVHADLGIGRNEAVEARDGQQAVLSALFSLPSSEHGRTGLNLSRLTNTHENYLRECLKNCAEVLCNSGLTRTINGRTHRFIFQNIYDKNLLSENITLYENGTTEEYGFNYACWDSPYLISACHLIGVRDLRSSEEVVRDFKNAILDEVLGQPRKPERIRWDTLVRACAKIAARFRTQGKFGKELTIGNEEEKDLFRRLLISGRAAFSLGRNHLLSAVESCLAAAAECDPADPIRSQLNCSVSKAFESTFAETKRGFSQHYDKALVVEVQRIFRECLNNASHLTYNSNIALSLAVSKEGWFRQGFTLCQVKDEKIVKSISTPEQFAIFIEEVVKEVFEKAKERDKDKEDRMVISQVIQAIDLPLKGPDFMRNVLHGYDSNKCEPDPKTVYRSLKETPMAFLLGTNPWEQIDVRAHQPFLPDVRTIRCDGDDFEEFLNWVIIYAQWKADSMRKINDVVEDKGTVAALLDSVKSDTASPLGTRGAQKKQKISSEGREELDQLKSDISSPVGRRGGALKNRKKSAESSEGDVEGIVFSNSMSADVPSNLPKKSLNHAILEKLAYPLYFDADKLKQFLSSKLPVQDWVRDVLRKPGLAISQSEIDSNAKDCYTVNVKDWIQRQAPLAWTTVESEVERLFETLNNRVMSLQQFAQRAQDGLESIFKLDAKQAKQWSLALDALFLQSINPMHLSAIQQSAMPIAVDSAESASTHIYCFFNPRTEKISLGRVSENKTLQPINFYEWIEAYSKEAGEKAIG